MGIALRTTYGCDTVCSYKSSNFKEATAAHDHRRFYSMDDLQFYVKQAGLLWLAGVKEACCLHRVLFFFTRSRELLRRTGQCFLLNGLIFLGSIFILNLVVTPILLWILPDQCQQFGSQGLCGTGEIIRHYSSLRFFLIKLFYIFWFYPLNVFSFVLSNIWYNDIAKLAFMVMGIESSSQSELSNRKNEAHLHRPAGIGGVAIGIGEQAYSLLLLTFFFLQVYAIGFIPYIGKAVEFLLLSWMYAYYCFEYGWNLAEVDFGKRLEFFESNWAFFSGFGSPCVIAIFFFSQLVSYGVMAILFPLFVLTAIATEAEQVILSHRSSWGCRELRKLKIFIVADFLAMKTLHVFFDARDKTSGKLIKVSE